MRGPADRRRREARLGYALLAPTALLIGAVALYPLATTVWLSLHQQDLKLLQGTRRFIGLGNYATLLGEARFWEALGHTLAFTAVSVSLEMGLGLGLALLLNRARIGRGALRAALLLPWTIPTVVAAVIWLFLVNPASGILVHFLRVLGVSEEGTVLLADPLRAWMVIVATDVWKTTPFVALLLLAALQVIPPELYEAAATDGARPWQALTRITLPLLRPAIAVALVFRTLQAVKVFDHIVALTGGGPGTATETVVFLAYHALLRDLNLGYGSAVSVVTFLLSLAFVLASTRFVLLTPEEAP